MAVMTDKIACSVYWIYGEGLTPLYVGIAEDVDRRLRQHAEKAWWRDVRRIDAKAYPSRDAASTVERSEIRRLAPRHNIVHNLPESRPPAPRIPRVNAGGRRRLVTVAAAAEYLGVTDRTIRNYVSRGQVTAYRLGARQVRLDLDELDTMLRPIPTVGNL